MSHSRQCVFVDPTTTRELVRTSTDLPSVGFEDVGANSGRSHRAELLLADVDRTRSLVGERTATQTRPLLK